MFAICVETSHARGMGHLYRALALTESLERHGGTVKVLVNEWEPALGVLRARRQAFEPIPLNNIEGGWEREIIQRLGVRVWVNDRLDTRSEHAQAVLGAGARLATLDDRGSGARNADLNIVAIPSHDAEILPGRHVLKGMPYLILDATIARYRHARTKAESMAVNMGGSDTYGVTVDVVRALRARGLGATILLGPGFGHDAALKEVLSDGFEVRRAVPSLAEEFARHDLAVTAGGITPYEANAAGLPVIVIATEPWEVRMGEVLEDLGGGIFAGARDRIDFSVFDRELPIEAMSRAALQNVPCGGVDRVAQALLAL